eukprot:SAG11_NODE_1345_length_5147_cov_3.840729_2_plen_54_part_00
MPVFRPPVLDGMRGSMADTSRIHTRIWYSLGICHLCTGFFCYVWIYSVVFGYR